MPGISGNVHLKDCLKSTCLGSGDNTCPKRQAFLVLRAFTVSGWFFHWLECLVFLPYMRKQSRLILAIEAVRRQSCRQGFSQPGELARHL
jgi:hypothetical protein